MIEIYEIYNYLHTDSDMFKEYIQKWLKIKMELSGYPQNATTDEAKAAFIHEVFEREGIQLDSDKIEKNPGLRFIAKLFLNSLWGKLAERPNKPQTVVLYDYPELWSLHSNEEIELLGEWMPVENMMVINYCYKHDKDASPGNTCRHSSVCNRICAFKVTG